MPQPTPYNRVYDFSDFQVANPAKPLPASALDAELDAVKLTTDQLRQNLGQIQRDDGRLANQLVTPESLAPGVLAMIGQKGYNPRGAWAAGQQYAVEDVVEYNLATFVCIVGHESTAVFADDRAAGRWLMLANAALTGSAAAVDLLEGDGTATVFNLSLIYQSSLSANVFVGGVAQIPGQDFTISGSVLTFVVAPPAPAVPGRKNVMVRGTAVEAQVAASAALQASIDAQGYAVAADEDRILAQQAAVTATSQAGIATTQAGIATDQAGIATTEAAAAEASRVAADAAKVAAQAAETDAEAAAATATTQAGIATTKAAEADADRIAAETARTDAQAARDTALTHRNDAQTAAGTATTKAAEAVGSANAAAASATEAAGYAAIAQNIPSGTKMLFIQSTAPAGWTKDTTHDNKALRIVSGTAGSGGTVDFTTAFASKAVSGSVSVWGSVGDTVLSVNQIPSHNHQLGHGTQNGPGGGGWNWKSQNAGAVDWTYATGSGWGHNHSLSVAGSFTGTAIDLAVRYVDAIICTKD